MGNDYEQRKRKKKRNRTDDKEPDERRNKRKRPAIRRLCRGMCYNKPELTEEDKVWTEDAGEEGEETRAEAAALAFAARVKEVEEEEKQAARSKRKRRKAAGNDKFSTGVHLIEPANASNALGSKGKEHRLEPLSESLRSLPGEMQQVMLELGFSDAMPIQERCWPLCLAGRDLAATAEPGSGKTLAYLLPLACLLKPTGDEGRGPSAVVLVPTRELAQQVASQCRVLWKLFKLRTALIMGGTEREGQVEILEQKTHIVVATPGRLLDLAEDGIAALARADDYNVAAFTVADSPVMSSGAVRYVVLDEADKMLDLGLGPQLSRLKQLLLPPNEVGRTPKKIPGPVKAPKMTQPQVVMLSATLTPEFEAAAESWLRDPARVNVGPCASNISRTVVQTVHVCAEHKKPQKLLRHLQQIKEQTSGCRNPPRALIFVNRIKTARFVQQTVVEEGFRCVVLHGERSQSEREEAMRAFRSGKAQIMVATDVAARGLHIRGLPYVVNYDFPSNLGQYIHRAGRTGRLATDGHCFSFFTRNLAAIAGPLATLLREHGQALDPNLVQLAEAYDVAAAKLRDAEQGSPGSDEPLPDTSGSGEDSEDVDADPAPTLVALQPVEKPKSHKRQALPGRLRKKLAREKLAAD